ncbi:tRNA lysidine(34) synthetase TilS [Patiriisocius sp. Uisw_047]|uniref:tRNA lysidine(34) synthetase TilS n=1 Tax=Patiriisocius sp. Uisw_047 TaxID=3230969 RepID=UPI0039ED0DDA
MLTSFKKHIDQTFPRLCDKKIILACSGGLDSVLLAHLLKQLNFNFCIAHCNFNLRGDESDGDAAFVAALATLLKVPFYEEVFDTKAFAKDHRISTQMSARELRYEWFEQLRKQIKFDLIATAHHADDVLETVLINLSRGTGIRGLTGIPEETETLIRPLLPFSRDEVLRFAKKAEFFWREDSSNAATDYLRNELRHRVIPPYKKASKNVLKGVRNTITHLQATEQLVADYMVLLYNLLVTETVDGYEIDIIKLGDLPNQGAVLYELLSPFGFTAWDDIIDLATAQSGKLVFSDSHRLLKDRTKFILTVRDSIENISEEITINKNESQVIDPVPLTFIPTDKIGYVDSRIVYVDAALLVYPLIVRKWREGDVFQPFGLKGNKKISKFYKDEKLSLAAKEKTWLLCSGKTIVWVIGMRADDRFKVTEKTTQIVKITTN